MSSIIRAKARARKVTIRARVYRASTGQWEDLGVIARTESGIMVTLRRVMKRLLRR